MKKTIPWLCWPLLATLAGAGYWLWAHQPDASLSVPDPELHSSALRIVPNQGQWSAAARYRIRLSGGEVWLKDQALTYHFFDLPQTHGHPDQPVDPRPERIQGHVFQAHFVGSQPQPTLTPGLRYAAYHNYYLGRDPNRWASRVPLYGLLTYEQLYPGIDLRVYGVGDHMKYDFIVAPGQSPDQIRVAYQGIEPQLNEAGQLVFQTALRTLTEEAPLAYQLIDGEKRVVACRYRLEKGVLSYAFPEGYDPDYALVIDPTLIFSTYTGSLADNWGFTSTYDSAGNAYGGGIQYAPTASAQDYPTTPGAYDRTFDGGISDVTIAKFAPNGDQLLYSTFLGGQNDDQPHSMVVNSQNELVVMGRTSSADFPTPNGYDPTIGGMSDIFVARFSEDGAALRSATFLGGSGEDGVNGSTDPSLYTDTKYNYGDDARGEVIVDADDNVYLAAPSQSFDFPTPGGAFQRNYAGNQDGVVIKLSPDLGNLIWSTYVGGSQSDAIHTLKLDAQRNVYIAGGSNSPDLLTTAGGINPNPIGGVDGFVVQLSADGRNLLQGTYLGTNTYDQVYLMEVDEDGDVYVVGQTEGNFPVVDPPAGRVYQNNGARQFIAKLSPTLDRFIFSTRFGSTSAFKPNISPTAFLVDVCGNMYVTGWGGSTNRQGSTVGMPVTNDAFQPNTDGDDFYLIVLERDAQGLLYGSFFGANGVAEHVDGGTSRFDKNGVVYQAVCAGCGGFSTFPTTPGVVSRTNGSTNCNLAVFKFAFDLAGVSADFTPLNENNDPLGPIEGCAPLRVNFDNESSEGANPGVVNYFWDFANNGDNSTAFEPTYLYEDPGTYEVMLVITDSSSCNISDTTFRTVVVRPLPAVDAGPDQQSCPGDTVVLQTPTVAESYAWRPAALVVGDPNQPTVEVQVPAETRFILTVTDSAGCLASDTVTVSIDGALDVAARADTTICRGGGLTLSADAVNNSSPITQYRWSSIPAGADISDPTAAQPQVSNLDSTTLFVVEMEEASGCLGTDTFQVEVFEVFTLEDTALCRGDTLLLETSNGASFTWTPNDGSISDTSVASPQVYPTANTTYTVEAVSADGCISVKDVQVVVRESPTSEAGEDVRLCVGSSVTLSGSGGQVFTWQPAGSLSDPTVAAPVATPEQTTDYVLTVTDASGCQDQDTVEVQVDPLPTVEVGTDPFICEGDAAQLQASGAQTYQWSPARGLSNPDLPDPLASPSVTTTYVVRGQDANGCEGSDSVVVNIIPRPITQVQGTNLCDQGFIELNASGGDRYRWSTGDTTATVTVTPPIPTTYVVQAVVGQCEGLPDSITVGPEFGYPTAAFDLNLESNFAPQVITVSNNSTEALTYQWTPSFGNPSVEVNPTFNFPSAGEYRVQLVAISEGGCTDTAVQTFLLENAVLSVPSAFTPNGDEVNDAFLVGTYGLRSLEVQVFSRWGLVVFESDNLDFNWDGTYQNRPVPEGVYVYVIRAVGENDNNYLRRGTVTVVR